MKNISYLIDSKLPEKLPHFLKNTDTIFFDIETTGFHRKHSSISIIGYVLIKGNSIVLGQILLQSPIEEKEALLTFKDIISSGKLLVHYNGSSFDLPFLIAKCRFYGICPDFLEEKDSFDIYRNLLPFKKIFPKGMKQKSMEVYTGFQRTDKLSGAEVVTTYQNFIKTGAEEYKKEILLHNKEDLLGMFHVADLLRLKHLSKANSIKISLSDDEQAKIDARIKEPFSYNFIVEKEINGQSCLLSKKFDELQLNLPIFHGELYYFFPDFKNYYYLPSEDTAIHKSIGKFVDKEHRIQASQNNCYQKRTDRFLPFIKKDTNFPVFYDLEKKNRWIRIDDIVKDSSTLQQYFQDLVETIIMN